MNRIALIITLVLSLSFTGYSWERTYGDTCDDETQSVCKGWDEGYIIVGIYNPTSALDGEGVPFAFKIDEVGDTIWYRTYGDTIKDQTADCIIKGHEGEYVILGNEKQYINWYNPFLLIINNSGDTVLYEQYDSIGGICHSIAKTGESGYIFTGSKSYGSTGPPRDLLLVRVDRGGDTLWKRTYGGDIRCEGREVIECPDGSFLVCGNTQWYEYGRYMENFLLIKVNSEGDSLWGRVFGERFRCSAYSILTQTDKIYIGGYIFPDTLLDLDIDMFVLCTDSDGYLLWEKKIGGSAHDIGPFDMEFAYDGGIMLLGNTSSSGAGINDIYLVKCSYDGDSLWARTYGTYLDEWSHGIVKTADNGYLIAATMVNDYTSNTDIYIIKVDSLGISTSIEEQTSDMGLKPLAYEISAYPNPFNSSVSITAPAGAEIEIFDINGRMVDNISVGEGPRAFPSREHTGVLPYECVWQPSKSIGTGVYLVRATVGEQSTSKRIVYLK